MQFYKEKKQAEVRQYKGWVESAERAAKKSETQEELIIWEIGNAVETEKIYSTYGGYNWLNIFIEPLTPAEFDTLMEIVNGTTEAYGYTVQENGNYPEMIYKNGYQTLNVQIIARECRLVKTGKMIPEERKDCIFIKE